MKKFLNKYDTMIFDMDGVVTSESGYWDAAALTVCEFLTGSEYFGNETIDIKYLSDNVKAIRKEVFLDDKLITLFKGLGVNSNWDLGYITVLISLIIGKNDAQSVYDYAEKIEEDIIDAYDTLAKLAAKRQGALFEEYRRNGKLWTDMQDKFQEWYLGDDMYYETYKKEVAVSGKSGIYKNEEPIVTLVELKDILGELSETKRLGIATGRVRLEIVPMLKQWGVLDCFDENALCTYDYVISGEQETNATLTKPHPYMFLKALYGLNYPNNKIVDRDYDKSKIGRTLVVGDAGADILAAQAMGADFCAVLTGIAGQSGRTYFEEQKADYILNDIRELM